MLKYDLTMFVGLLVNPLLLIALGLPRALSLGAGRVQWLGFGAVVLLAASLLGLVLGQINLAIAPELPKSMPTFLSVRYAGLLTSAVTGAAIWLVLSRQTRALSGLLRPPGIIDVLVLFVALVLTAIPYVLMYAGMAIASTGFFQPLFINTLFSKTILIFGFTWAILLMSVETSPTVRWPWWTIVIATIMAAGPASLISIFVRLGTVPEPVLRFTLYSLPLWVLLSLLRAWSRWPWIVFVLPTAIALFAFYWLGVLFKGL